MQSIESEQQNSTVRTVAERALVIFAALALSGALWRFFGDGTSAGIEGDSHIEVVLVFIYFLVAIFILIDFQHSLFIFQRNPALVALLILATLSPIWSESPDLVFRRTLGMGGAALFGVVLAKRYTFDEQLSILRWAFRIAAVGTVLIILVSPSRAMMPSGDVGLRGVFAHKNGLGSSMALAFLVEWHLEADSTMAKALKWLSLGVFAGLLVVSNSMSSIVTLFATLTGVWIIRELCFKRHVPFSALAITAVVGFTSMTVMGFSPGELMGFLGRSSDLTGRTELWSSVIDAIEQKPILGYGFSGFWRGATAGSDAIGGQLQWAPVYSHNGYLEISLSLGLVGLALAIAFLAKGFKRAWATTESGESRLHQWPLALMVFIAVHNLTECTIAWQNCLEWSVCVATIISSELWMLASAGTRDETEPVVSESVEPVIA